MSESESVTGQSEILLEAARPDLFRVNAFRVTELPVDATARDLVKRQQIIEMASKTGLAVPPGPGRALPLPDSGGLDAVYEAMQRLRDPERRLVDEFFWFWPHQLGQSRRDEALLALAQGDIKAATNLWLRQEQSSEMNVSMHNLAVLSHATALDFEWLGTNQSLTDEQKKQRDLSWRQAFIRWKILLDYEGFWSRLTARIRDLDDPRLPTGTARRIRQSLPLALILINAQLAVRAVEAGAIEQARRHLRIIKESGFENTIIDEALRRAVEPIRERIKTFGKSAEEKATAEPVYGDDATRRLITQTKPLLMVLDTLLPDDHPTRVSMHDEVARRILACQILFANKTENWRVSVELLEVALPIAASASVRARLEENLQIVKRNLEFQQMYGTCFFCKKRSGEDNAAAEIKMVGNVNRIPLWNGTRITWQNLTVRVPRCRVCKTAHANATTLSGAIYTIGLLIGLGGCSVTMAAAKNAEWLGIIVFGGLLVIAGIIASMLEKKTLEGILPLSAQTQFPAVQDLIGQGWAIGEKPEGVN